MHRIHLLGLLLIVPGMMTSSIGAAAVPDPAFSTILNVIYCPRGDLIYRCQINSAPGTPCGGIMVDLVFSAGADASICWCDAPPQPHPVISALTDPFGVATFNIRAGGCMLPVNNGGAPVVAVIAAGVPMGNRISISPDAVDNGGRLPGMPGYLKQCQVGLSDAVYHTPPIKGVVYRVCSDLNSDGVTGLSDAVILTPHLSLAHSCTPQP